MQIVFYSRSLWYPFGYPFCPKGSFAVRLLASFLSRKYDCLILIHSMYAPFIGDTASFVKTPRAPFLSSRTGLAQAALL